jgi:hypothetical protein
VGAPGLVQRIDGHGLELGAGLGGGGLQAVQGLRAVQAGVVADDGPGLGGFQIGGNAALDEVADLEHALVDLLAHLQGVAAVDKDGGAVTHDHTGPGAAGEAAGPGQAVIGGGQVLVLMLVLVRHEEAVQTLLGHGGADQGNVTGTKGRVGGFIESLAHAPM